MVLSLFPANPVFLENRNDTGSRLIDRTKSNQLSRAIIVWVGFLNFFDKPWADRDPARTRNSSLVPLFDSLRVGFG